MRNRQRPTPKRDPKSPYWQYQFYVDTRRYKGSTGETDKARAQRVIEAIWQEALALSEHRQRTGRGPITMGEAAQRWWDSIGSHTTETYLGPPSRVGSPLHRLVCFFNAGTELAKITNDHVARYRDERRHDRVVGSNRRVSARTVNDDIQLLRRIMLAARDKWDKQLPKMPKWGEHLLEEKKNPNPRVLTFEERARLDAVERPELKAIRSFVLLTSVRLEEAISLKWSNVDFERGIVTLVQKGERHREIPMTEEIRSLLPSLHGRHPEAVFTFVARKTRRDPHTGEMLIAGNVYPWSYWGVKSAERRDWAKAGLKVKGSRSYASFHDLRRTAARDQYDAAGVYAARDLLGHANVKTTQTYLGVSDEGTMRANMDARDAYVAKMKKNATDKTAENPTDKEESRVKSA